MMNTGFPSYLQCLLNWNPLFPVSICLLNWNPLIMSCFLFSTVSILELPFVAGNYNLDRSLGGAYYWIGRSPWLGKSRMSEQQQYWFSHCPRRESISSLARKISSFFVPFSSGRIEPNTKEKGAHGFSDWFLLSCRRSPIAQTHPKCQIGNIFWSLANP